MGEREYGNERGERERKSGRESIENERGKRERERETYTLYSSLFHM